MRKILNNEPNWRYLNVKPHYSGELEGLDKVSRNLWWSWNCEAIELLKYIAEDDSISHCINPVEMLAKIPYERYEELENDSRFLKRYKKVLTDFENYINTPYKKELPRIAYFSMEYGLTKILKIYSGGLGVLAGDYLKQASDSGYDMAAVGLFYRQGYFTQKISVKGEQEAEYYSQKFSDLPAELLTDEAGEAITVSVPYPGRNVYAQIWEVKVGRISLYLLDTDRNDNSDEDKGLTYRLYGGDHEHRLKQEILLGVGGIKLLEKLNYNREIYHCNEGHAAFISVERLQNLTNKNSLKFREALEVVRASTLFTTHTPVPAGHDAFDVEWIKKYLGYYAKELNISLESFIDLGLSNVDGKFSMSILAASTSQEINGVSMLHGKVSRERIFNKVWDGYYPDELNIGYVTNGVHFPTWTAKDWIELLKGDDGNPDFSKIYRFSDEEIWEMRLKRKKQLIKYVRHRFDTERVRRRENPKHILNIKRTINDKTLTIGFARRFAEYKRGDLIFTDLERLEKIVNNAEMPVQFIFAGKAHPHDGGGQKIIKRIVEISKMPQFVGKIVFVENYNMSVAKQLVQGVDIWLNTPTRPLEASGTSGMKAVMNGVLNFSILDGWWVEGYKEGAGWALPEKKTYDNQQVQDAIDAEMLYQKLENEIIPLFYKVNEQGVPAEWVQYIKKCISEIAPNFTTKRMIDDYQRKYYGKLSDRYLNVTSDNFKFAKELSEWKDFVLSKWDDMKIVNSNISDTISDNITHGNDIVQFIVLDANGLSKDDIGIELVMMENDKKGKFNVVKISEITYDKTDENGHFCYSVKLAPPRPGGFDYSFRIFPKHKNLAHRQDFPIVRWV